MWNDVGKVRPVEIGVKRPLRERSTPISQISVKQADEL
jgi:hypothetical protein